ncbi:MAG: DUF4294 domain-containing protein [Bacteroidetes bacterium]|jgi:hypothetical protein|nr:DUF4294 domain-containing protein [Bacteroidota bacterium]
MKSVLLILFTFFSLISCLNAQVSKQDLKNPGFGNDTVIVAAKVLKNDTIPVIQLPEVSVYAWSLFDSRRDSRKIERLIYHVKKVYPYAKLAGIKLREYEDMLQAAPNDRERRRIMKKAEEEINEQFGAELRDLTFTQGKILIKLIDRETKETSFTLLKEMRGGVTAFFYQGFARIWGYNLKTKYDPQGEDELIETIIFMIETGRL